MELTKKTALGIEFGSTRIKAMAIDERFTPVSSGDYIWASRYENGVWTYPLDEVWTGLKMALSGVEHPENICAVGVSGMMHGYLAFDQDWKLLTPFRTWQNTITGPAAEELTALFGFNIPQRWSVAHLYQAVLNGEKHISQIAHITTLAGYVHMMLTGVNTVGVGEASGMFPIDSKTLDYDGEMLAKFDTLVAGRNLPWKLADLLPKVLPAGLLPSAFRISTISVSTALEPIMDRTEEGYVMNEECTAFFGHMPDGTSVKEITLKDGPVSCCILTYGGALRTLTVPDRSGQPVDVVLGFDTLEDYIAQDKYIGALIGRYANRIAGSRFVLEGKEYPLRANDGPNHLHGGSEGFDKKVWQIRAQTRNSVSLYLISPDGQEGYPGSLEVVVTYTLQDMALEISYTARSSRTTLCNLTNHTYFNLSGHQSGTIQRQYIQLLADRFTPSEGAIPTGVIESVAGTAMDLRTLQPIGSREYDHNWTVNGWDGVLRPAALAWSPDTGILMETLTTLPGIQFYTGNFLDGCPSGKGNTPYARNWAFCLETQYYPDSPNHPDFPSAILSAGEVYENKTVYHFEIGEKGSYEHI